MNEVNYFLTEIYKDPIENSYKFRGQDLIEKAWSMGIQGSVEVRHSFGFFAQKEGQKVVIETKIPAKLEEALIDMGLVELSRNKQRLQDLRTTDARKVPLAVRYILKEMD